MSTATPATVYEPFTWLSEAQQQAPHVRLLELLGNARDMAAGAAEISAILERINIDSCGGDEDGNPLPQLLNASTCGNLNRLVVVGLNLLTDHIDEALAGDTLACDQAAALPSLIDLAAMLPKDPCAGQMLTAEEAAALSQLRDLLQAKAVQQ